MSLLIEALRKAEQAKQAAQREAAAAVTVPAPATPEPDDWLLLVEPEYPEQPATPPAPEFELSLSEDSLTFTPSVADTSLPAPSLAEDSAPTASSYEWLDDQALNLVSDAENASESAAPPPEVPEISAATPFENAETTPVPPPVTAPEIGLDWGLDSPTEAETVSAEPPLRRTLTPPPELPPPVTPALRWLDETDDAPVAIPLTSQAVDQAPAKAAAQLMAQRSKTPARSRIGLYLALLGLVCVLLGGGYYYVQQLLDSLNASPYGNAASMPPPPGGLAAKLEAKHKVANGASTASAAPESPAANPEELLTLLGGKLDEDLPRPATRPLTRPSVEKPRHETAKATATPRQTVASATTSPATPLSAADQQAIVARDGFYVRRAPAPPRVNPQLQAAYQAYQAGETTVAQQHYQAVLNSDAQNRDALLGLAALAQRSGRLAQAQGYYQQVLMLYPGDELAEAGLLLGQTTPADDHENLLKAQLAYAPQATATQFALGNFYSRQGRWGDAQQAYFEAYRGQNNHPDYAYNLAVSLDHLGKTQAALAYYQKALTLAADRPAQGFTKTQVTQRIAALNQVRRP